MLADSSVITRADVDALIVTAAAQVLEKMFFTGIETSGNEGDIKMDSPVQVELHFDGPLSGALRLQIDEQVARSLGSSLTCLEPDEFSRDRCVQLAGELANMICGCLLSHLEPEANLALTPPVETPEPTGAKTGIRRWFCLPEGELIIHFLLEPICDSSPPARVSS